MAAPKPIGNILAELLAKRGYARVQAENQFAEAWRSAAGEPLARLTRAGQVKRGVLEIWCGNSALVQEMAFQKQSLIKKLTELVPAAKIKDLKVRVGTVEPAG